MRWKVDSPRHNEVRMVRRFAWKPVVVQGYRIWLEYYWRHQFYASGGYWLDYDLDNNRYPAKLNTKRIKPITENDLLRAHYGKRED